MEAEDDKPVDAAKAVCILDYSKARRGPLQLLAVFLWSGWMAFYFFFPAIAGVLYLYAPVVLAALIGLMVISALTTVDPRRQPKFTRAIGPWLMIKAAEYFHLRVFVEDLAALQDSSPALFALEPHGVLPLGMGAFYPGYTGFTGHRVMSFITSVCFKLPLMRHIYTWMAAGAIEKKNLQRFMNLKYSPVICPGGVQECIHLDQSISECVLYLRKRKGFVKLALKYAYPIIPVFNFGLHNTYRFFVPKSAWLSRIGRKIGALPMVFSGVFGIPFGPPKWCDLVNVIGKPIILPHIADPTEEDVNKYHDLFLQEMERLFETYKADFGMEDFALKII